MKMYHVLVIAAAFTGLASCQKQNQDQGSQANVAISVKAVNPAVILAASTGRLTAAKTESIDLTWSKATASASQLKFEAEKNGSELEFKSSVQQTIDLFSTTASFGNIGIPPGTYNEIEVKAILNPIGTTPALDMTGTLVSNNVSTPVHFTANESIELKGEKSNVTIGSSTVQSAAIALNFTKVLNGIVASEFDNATRTNGTILITSDNNAKLYGKILKNLRELKEESEFHK